MGDVMFCHKSLPKSCRMGRRSVVMKLICSLAHCERNGHTVRKLSRRRLTADWLAPWDSDCSWTHSKVSSEWLPSCIKAIRPVLEIFKLAGYFPDSPHMKRSEILFLLISLRHIRESQTYQFHQKHLIIWHLVNGTKYRFYYDLQLTFAWKTFILFGV